MKDFRGFCQEMDEAIKEGEGNTFTKRQQDMDRVFTEMTEKLSCALVGFVNSLNPQKIIIGHEGYWIPDPYLCKIEKLVNERHIERKYSVPGIPGFRSCMVLPASQCSYAPVHRSFHWYSHTIPHLQPVRSPHRSPDLHK